MTSLHASRLCTTLAQDPPPYTAEVAHRFDSVVNTQVELKELDAQMVRLARKHRAHHAALIQKENLHIELTKVQ